MGDYHRIRHRHLVLCSLNGGYCVECSPRRLPPRRGDGVANCWHMCNRPRHATLSSFRSWAFVVLVLDMALVFKRYHLPSFIIPSVLVYQAALQVESVSRFGLYEAGYWGTKGVEIS
eukprot:Hpha_TRINITY_DN16272_c0_g1::TRINITY_DN16272_c0_g1_i3::g.12511::m.12511